MPYRPKGSRFWHYDFQIRGRRFHGSCGTEDYEEAKAVEAQERVRAKADPKSQGRFTLSEAIGTYWSDVCQYQPSARTALAQGRQVIEIIGAKVMLDELTNGNFSKFVAKRRATVTNATVNRQLDLADRAIRYMVKTHGSRVSPDLDIKSLKLREPKERIRELTWAEQKRLFEHLRPDLHNLVKGALLTGARLDTLCGLRWDDIDWDEELILFRVKMDGRLRFVMGKELRAFLSSLPRAEEEPHSDHVFTYERQNRKGKPRHRIPSTGGGLMADWREALKTARIHDFRFHDLRHTFATRLLRETGNIKLVSQLLGHSDIETTTRYAHVLDEDARRAVVDFTMLATDVSRRKSRRKSGNQ